MTIQALARIIVETVLSRLDHHTFAAIPEADIRTACNAVAQLIREESAPVSILTARRHAMKQLLHDLWLSIDLVLVVLVCACFVLLLLLGCTQEPPPLPPVPNAPDDLSTWSVPELVQPPAPPPEPVPEPVAPKSKQPSAEQIFEYAPGTTFSLTVPVGAPLDIVFERGSRCATLSAGDRAPTEGSSRPLGN